MSLSKNTNLTHPATAGWFEVAANHQPFTNEERRRLYNRYKDTGVDIRDLLATVHAAIVRGHNYRALHEAENVSRLQLEAHEQERYQQLAGNATSFGKFVEVFSHIATRALASQGNTAQGRRISLELAGTRQAGDWEATHMLDEAIRLLPSQLASLEQPPAVGIYGAEKTHKRYRFKPYILGTMEHMGEFEYAEIRRRRPVADVYFEGATALIFKQSVGLMLRSQLPDNLKKQFTTLYESCNAEEYRAYQLNNSVPAMLGGKVFEAAITERQCATTVVPIGALYIMSVRGSEDTEKM